jgi:hypothetical protein
MKNLYLLLAFLLLAACCRVDGSSHDHHQCSPELGSFFEVPLHSVFTESYYSSELKLCKYMNGFLKGIYGKGAMFEGELTIVHGTEISLSIKEVGSALMLKPVNQ